jgi:hypothetical protein
MILSWAWKKMTFANWITPHEAHIICGFLGSDTTANPVIAALPPLLALNVAEAPGSRRVLRGAP